MKFKLVSVSLLLWSVPVIPLVVTSACSTSDDTGTNPSPVSAGGSSGDYKSFCDLPVPCQRIAQACHPKDTGAKGPIHDCHLTGHAVGTLAACAPVLASCLETCNGAPALSDGPVEDLGASCRDAAAPDAGH